MEERPILMIAAPYDDSTVSTITAGFSRMFGRQLDFEVVEDKDILGGFIAIIDGKVYDESYSSRLYDLGRKISE